MTQDFRFDPVRFALPEGHSLFPIRDLDCYATLAARVGVCPHGFMLADLGPDPGLFERHTGLPGTTRGGLFDLLFSNGILIFPHGKT